MTLLCSHYLEEALFPKLISFSRSIHIDLQSAFSPHKEIHVSVYRLLGVQTINCIQGLLLFAFSSLWDNGKSFSVRAFNFLCTFQWSMSMQSRTMTWVSYTTGTPCILSIIIKCIDSVLSFNLGLKTISYGLENEAEQNLYWKLSPLQNPWTLVHSMSPLQIQSSMKLSPLDISFIRNFFSFLIYLPELQKCDHSNSSLRLQEFVLQV